MPERSLSVVVFSGGRGSSVLSRELIANPRIDLTLAINGYDDGMSTGEVRRFLGDALGPSDFRKNASHLARTLRTCDDAAVTELDRRLPVGSTRDAAIAELGRIGGAMGGAIGGLFGGHAGSVIGGIAGGINVKKGEANVTLSLVNAATTEEEALTEGYYRKRDLSFAGAGGAGWWGGFGAAGGYGYQNTEIGQIIVLAYLDAYKKLVTQLGGQPVAMAPPAQ